MTKLTHNLGAKIIACFLVIIAGFGAIGSGAGAYYAYEHGFYDGLIMKEKIEKIKGWSAK